MGLAMTVDDLLGANRTQVLISEQRTVQSAVPLNILSNTLRIPTSLIVV